MVPGQEARAHNLRIGRLASKRWEQPQQVRVRLSRFLFSACMQPDFAPAAPHHREQTA